MKKLVSSAVFLVFLTLNFSLVLGYVDPNNVERENIDYEQMPLNESQLGSPKIYGYTIQFEDEPTLVRKTRLEKEIKELDKKIASAKPVIGAIPNLFRKSKRSAKQEEILNLDDYSEELKEKHKEILSEVSMMLSPKMEEGKNLFDSIKGIFSKKKQVQLSPDFELKIDAEFTDVFNGVSLNISAEEAEKIEKIDGVKEIYPNYEVKALLMDSVPLIEADKVWQLDKDGGVCATSGKDCLTGKGVKIAIIDSGVDYTHPDLGGCLGADCKVIGGYNFLRGNNDPMDDEGHGTHVAASAAGNGDWDKDGIVEPGEGLNGVAPDAKILAYKVLGLDGSGNPIFIVGAIGRAVNDGANIISMSLGGLGNPDDPLSQTVDNAVNAGVVVVVAAGNSGPNGNTRCRNYLQDGTKNSICSPGTARKAITIGATYKKDYPGDTGGKDIDPKQDQIIGFSSRGPVIWKDSLGNSQILSKPDVVAPGALICAARYDNIYPEGEHRYYKPCIDEKHVQMAGTSMAAPIVSGAVALLKQKNPGWSPEQIKQSLMNTAIDIKEEINTQGYGRINTFLVWNPSLISYIREIEPIVSGAIEIIGTAKGEGFTNYILEIKENKKDALYTLLYEENNPVEDDVLFTFDTRTLKDGEYVLRLTVNGIDNQKSYYSRFVRIENIQITSPFNAAVITKEQSQIDITGTVLSLNLEHFTLEYCKETCKIIIQGNSVVENNLLGVWDITQVPSGEYELRLTVHYLDLTTSIDSVNVLILSNVKSGWPQPTCGRNQYSSPIIDDIDGDNLKEIMFGAGTDDIAFPQRYLDIGHCIHVFDVYGNNKPNWPFEFELEDNFAIGNSVVGLFDNEKLIFIDKYVLTNKASLSDIKSGEVLVDIDNDGELEILSTRDGQKSGEKCVYFFNKDGSVVNGWPSCLSSSIGNEPSNPEGNYYSFGGLPVVGDVNNDGYKEVFVGTYLLTYDGKVMPGWPKRIKAMIDSSPLLADIDNDDELEILLPNNFELYVWNYDGSNVQEIIKSFGGLMVRPPAVGDLDNDGKPEIVVLSDYEIEAGLAYYNTVINVIKSDGSNYPGWPKTVYNTYLFKKGYHIIYDTYLLKNSAPLIADVAGDGYKEIIMPIDSYFKSDRGTGLGHVSQINIYSHDGQVIEEKILGRGALKITPAIDDIDNNGKEDLVVVTYDQIADNIPDYNLEEDRYQNRVFVFEFDKKSENIDNEYRMLNYNPQKTGCYMCDVLNVCEDKDTDGFDTCEIGQEGDDGKEKDCNDNFVNGREIFPGAIEKCNGFDDNCNEQVDENNGDCLSDLEYCVSGKCVKCRNDADCNDDLFCNGIETCNPTLGCVAGIPPVVDDNIPCTEDLCIEEAKRVIHSPISSRCDDNLFCNGQETCNPTLGCVSGNSIDCSANDISISQCDYTPDGNSKTWDLFAFKSTCDEGLDSCIEINEGWESEITHECNKEECNAECIAQEECNDGNPATLDTCLPDCICLNAEEQFKDAKVLRIRYSGRVINGKEKEISFDIENAGNFDLTSLNYFIEYEKDGSFIELASDIISEIKVGEKTTINKNIIISEIGKFNLRARIEVNEDASPEDNAALKEIDVLEDICYIDGLKWSRQEADAGESVFMEIDGENCEEKMINLGIYEKDGEIFLLPNPDDLILDLENIIFSNNIEWKAEWQEDEKGNPEYYFVVNDIKSDELKVRLIAKEQMKKESAEILLKPGKNVISIPLIADGMSIEAIFGNVKDKLVKIYTYDNGWKIHYFDEALARLSNLDIIEPGKGYVVIAKADIPEARIQIEGVKRRSDLTLPLLKLRKGWNLIGTFSIPSKAGFILGEVGYKLYVFEDNEFKEVDSERELKLDEGFWVYSDEEKEVNIIPALSPEDSENIFKTIWRKIFR